MTTLVTKLLALHDTLAAAGVAHAFGGAIALAYCTEDPRGTRDVDINVFVDATAAQPVLDALPREWQSPPTRQDGSPTTARSGCGGTTPRSTCSSTTRRCTRRPVDAERVRQGLVELVGADDSRVARWDSLRT